VKEPRTVLGVGLIVVAGALALAVWAAPTRVAATVQLPGPSLGSVLALVSPLRPAPTSIRPAAPARTVRDSTFDSIIVPTPAPDVVVPVAEPPFLAHMQDVTPQPFQVMVRDGNQVWLLSDTGERELLIDTSTRLGLYLGPGGLLETDVPGVEWGGPSRDGDTVVLAVANYANRQRDDAHPPFLVQLYLLEVASGSLHYLADGEDPVISPDGLQVIFKRPGGGWFLLATRAGSVPEPLPEAGEGCYLRRPVWSPSSDKVAVAEYCGAEAHVRLLDPGTRQSEVLHTIDYRNLDIGLYPELNLSWWPDGEYLAYMALGGEADDKDRRTTLWQLPISGAPPRVMAGGREVLSYAISPDGRHIALASPGEYWMDREVVDLWLADVAGGRTLRLTRDEAYDSPMAWTEDGRLVFLRYYQGLWTLDLVDGLMRQFMRSTNGAEVVLIRGWQEPWHTPGWKARLNEPFSLLVKREDRLWLVQAGARREQLLLEPPCEFCWTLDDIAVSPDGSQVAYLVRNRLGPYIDSGFIGLVQVSLSPDTEPRRLAYTESGIALSWWDPSQVACRVWTDYGSFFVILDVSSGERTEQPSDTLHYRSPDGRYRLSGNGSTFGSHRLTPQPYVLEDTVTGERFLAVGETEDAQFMGWSPEGSLLFILSRPDVDQTLLAVVDPVAGVRRELTSGEEQITGAAWSPDGETIAYSLCRPAEDGCYRPELRLVEADGSDDRAVPLAEYLADEEGFAANRITEIRDVFWSPDGEEILFACRHGYRAAENIWGVRPDGSGLRPLARGEKAIAVPREGG